MICCFRNIYWESALHWWCQLQSSCWPCQEHGSWCQEPLQSVCQPQSLRLHCWPSWSSWSETEEQQPQQQPEWIKWRFKVHEEHGLPWAESEASCQSWQPPCTPSRHLPSWPSAPPQPWLYTQWRRLLLHPSEQLLQPQPRPQWQVYS